MRQRPDGKPVLRVEGSRAGGSASRLPPTGSVLVAVSVILGSLVILSLAIPRIWSSFALLPGMAAVDLIENGVRPGDAGIVRAIDAQTAALRVMARPEPHMDTAYLAQSLAEAAGSTEADIADLLVVARNHVAQALTMAPGHPRGWVMLAGSRVRDGDDDGAARVLSVSFAADPHVPLLAPFRSPLTHRLGSRLSRETREQANLEFLSFFHRRPEAAVRIALRQDRLAALMALAEERDDDRDRLDSILRRMQYEGAGT